MKQDEYLTRDTWNIQGNTGLTLAQRKRQNELPPKLPGESDLGRAVRIVRGSAEPPIQKMAFSGNHHEESRERVLMTDDQIGDLVWDLAREDGRSTRLKIANQIIAELDARSDQI